MLFNFPSRYLFAIGLATVFSLRWSLPPALGCIPKQPDSEKTRSDRGKRPYRPDTCCGTRPRSEGHRRSPTIALGLPYVTTRRAPKARRFDVGLFPIHSPLLRESLLVSFPPLNNMLKFSGCSRLNSGRTPKSREGGREAGGSLPTTHAPTSLASARVERRSETRPSHAGRSSSALVDLTTKTKSTTGDGRRPRRAHGRSSSGPHCHLRGTAGWAAETSPLGPPPRSSSRKGQQGDSIGYGSDPEADAVPGLTRDRHSRSEGRRSMCSAIHITSRT